MAAQRLHGDGVWVLQPQSAGNVDFIRSVTVCELSIHQRTLINLSYSHPNIKDEGDV